MMEWVFSSYDPMNRACIVQMYMSVLIQGESYRCFGQGGADLEIEVVRLKIQSPTDRQARLLHSNKALE